MEWIRTAEEARRERAFRQLVDTLSPDELDAIEETSKEFREGFKLR
jgi:hypothetical protein